MKRIAKYRRVSHAEQALHGLSIEAQGLTLDKWAEDNGVEYIGDYVDEGISATTLKRPGLQRLLDDIRAGQIDLVVFTKLDRWFRSVKHYYKIQEILDEHNVGWQAILEDYDTVTASGAFRVNIMLSVAENEARVTSERIKEVFKYKLSRGEAVTGAQPYGYIIGPDKRPRIDPLRQHVVEYIFRNYQATNQLKQTLFGAQKLDPSIGIKTVRNALLDEKYTGYYNGKPDYYPPYITYAEHLEMKEAVTKNVKTNRAGRVFLFSGLAVCPDCGRKMGGNFCNPQKDNRGYYMYRCPGHRIEKVCDNNAIVNEGKLEDKLLEIAKEKYDKQLLISEITEDDPDTVVADEVKEEIDRLGIMFRKGRIDEKTYDEECEKLETLLKSLDSPKTPNQAAETIVAENFCELYEDMTKAERKQFWRGLIHTLKVWPRDDYRLEVVWKD